MSELKSFVEAVLENRLAEAVKIWDVSKEQLRLDPVAAAMAGDSEALQTILNADRGILEGKLPPVDAPLLCCLTQSRLIHLPRFESGILECARLLLAAGANPDAFKASEWGNEEWHETALYGAAGVLNHPGLTKLLLEAGADPDDGVIQDGVYHGESLYHACDFPGKNECLRLLLEANPSKVAADYCLNRKLDFEDAEGVELFLSHGADPNGNKTRSALSHAVLRGRSEQILRMLLEAGADPNHRELDGTTPYIMARRLADVEASRLLEEFGARAEFEPHDALLIAAADGDDAEVKRLAELHPELVRSFSDLGRQEHDGFTLGSAGQVLHDMARLGHIRAIEVLLDLGVDPGLANPNGETALHWACIAGRYEAAALLAQRGASLLAVESGFSCIPIQWAYWGSVYWNEPHGDYAKTVEAMISAGSPLPQRLEGSPEVQAVLMELGVAGG